MTSENLKLDFCFCPYQYYEKNEYWDGMRECCLKNIQWPSLTTSLNRLQSLASLRVI